MQLPKSQTGYGFVLGSDRINQFQNLPIKEPGPGEVLLKVEAAGLCLSDHHILIAQNPNNPKNMVMGHEICGTIVKTGSMVSGTQYAVGTRHCVSICNGCGSCKYCRIGKDNLCNIGKNEAYGITLDGGFQEYLLVKNLRGLIPIPDTVTFESAASATDAILTPFHAIMKVKKYLGPASKCLVFGAGGLGLNAIQILNTFGCKIVCVDKKQDAGKYAIKFGAQSFYTNFNNIAEDKESFDFCFDFIGVPESVNCSTKYVAGGGKIVMVGMGRLKAMFPLYDLCRREVEVIFNFGGTSQEQAEILEWIRVGKLSPVVETRLMKEVPEYMEKMKRGELLGRVVFKPGSKL